MDKKISIISALLAIQKELKPGMKKDTAGAPMGGRKYMYTSLPNMMEIVRPIVNKHGCVMVFDVNPVYGKQHITLILRNKDEEIKNGIPFVVDDKQFGDIKKVGSSLTYSKRYLIKMMFGLCDADDADKDPNKTSVDQNATPSKKILWKK